MSKKGKALAHMQRQVNVSVSFDNPGSMGFTINTNSENDQDFMFLGEVEVGGAASALGLRNDEILLEIRNQTSCVSVNRCDLESDSRHYLSFDSLRILRQKDVSLQAAPPRGVSLSTTRPFKTL